MGWVSLLNPGGIADDKTNPKLYRMQLLEKERKYLDNNMQGIPAASILSSIFSHHCLQESFGILYFSYLFYLVSFYSNLNVKSVQRELYCGGKNTSQPEQWYNFLYSGIIVNFFVPGNVQFFVVYELVHKTVPTICLEMDLGSSSIARGGAGNNCRPPPTF